MTDAQTILKLSHFTSDPIDAVVSKSQEEAQYFKPSGLWVSVDGPDDWPSWCRSEEFGDIDNEIRYRVDLNSNCNVLILSTSGQLKDFNKKYSYTPSAYKNLLAGIGWINWKKVANDYQGLIIAPYCWELRLDPDVMWYYGWDCASGCIWAAEAVKSITPVAKPSE